MASCFKNRNRFCGYFRLTFARQIKPNLPCGENPSYPRLPLYFPHTSREIFIFISRTGTLKIELREERFARVPISRCQIKPSRARERERNRVVSRTGKKKQLSLHFNIFRARVALFTKRYIALLIANSI